MLRLLYRGDHGAFRKEECRGNQTGKETPEPICYALAESVLLWRSAKRARICNLRITNPNWAEASTRVHLETTTLLKSFAASCRGRPRSGQVDVGSAMKVNATPSRPRRRTDVTLRPPHPPPGLRGKAHCDRDVRMWEGRGYTVNPESKDARYGCKGLGRQC